MSSQHQRKILKTLFVRAIENGSSHKARLCFRRLKKLLAAPVVRVVTVTSQLSVFDSFKQALSNVGGVQVAKTTRRGLELLGVVVAGAIQNKRAAFEAIVSKTRSSTKRDIGRIMRLLSKKFLTTVDNRFLSEHIKVLVLKNRIQNPSVLNLLKQTDIEITQEDYHAETEIRTTEALLQIFLGLELFLPVDLWVTKIKEAYNRMFFRLLRSYGARRMAEQRNARIWRLLQIMEDQVRKGVGHRWTELAQFARRGRLANQRKAVGVENLVRSLEAAIQTRLRKGFDVTRANVYRYRMATTLAKMERERLQKGFSEIRWEALRPRKAREMPTQTANEVPIQAAVTKDVIIGTLPPKTSMESFNVLYNKSRRDTGTESQPTTGRGVTAKAGLNRLAQILASKSQVNKGFGFDSIFELARVTPKQKIIQTDSEITVEKDTQVKSGVAKKSQPTQVDAHRSVQVSRPVQASVSVTQTASGQLEKAALAGPQNRYSRPSASSQTRALASNFGTQPTAQTRVSYQQTEDEPPFDREKLKKTLKMLERLIGLRKLKNWTLAFEKIKNEVTVLEVIEIKDLTKDLDPVEIQVVGGRETGDENSDGGNLVRRSLRLDTSQNRQSVETGDVVFIRKSHFFQPEAQAVRYSQIVKPQSLLMDQMAEIRKEEGSRHSFAIQATRNSQKFRQFASSVILERVEITDPKKRSFLAPSGPDSTPPELVKSSAAKGLRARYK